jgi:hypothetical protein
MPLDPRPRVKPEDRFRARLAPAKAGDDIESVFLVEKSI